MLFIYIYLPIFLNVLHFLLEQIETVKIKSKNFPTHYFGVVGIPNELYLSNDKSVAFHVYVPGLSGDSDSASFKSVEDGKYIFNDNGLLYMKALSTEASADLKKRATFKISKDKFFDVSNIYMCFCF